MCKYNNTNSSLQHFSIVIFISNLKTKNNPGKENENSFKTLGWCLMSQYLQYKHKCDKV